MYLYKKKEKGCIEPFKQGFRFFKHVGIPMELYNDSYPTRLILKMKQGYPIIQKKKNEIVFLLRFGIEIGLGR